MQDYQNAFAELEILGVKAYADEESTKRKMTQNCVAPGSRDVMYMREICKGKSFKDTCEMTRKKAIASDAKGSRGVNSTMVQLFADLVADKVNVNQTVIGQQQGEDEDAVALANLSRIKPEIWKEIPRDV